MLKTLRVGMIGAGGWGENVIAAYQQNPFSQIEALADLNPQRAQEIARKYQIPRVYTDYRDMLEKEDLDIASVATPDFAHRNLCVIAWKRIACLLGETCGHQYGGLPGDRSGGETVGEKVHDGLFYEVCTSVSGGQAGSGAGKAGRDLRGICQD